MNSKVNPGLLITDVQASRRLSDLWTWITPGWIIWGCASLFYLYQFMLRVSAGVMAKEIMVDLQLSEAQFGVIAGAYFLTYALMQIPLGLLSDKYDSRKILLFAIGSCILGTSIFSCANSMTEAYVGRMLIGLGSSAAFLTCIKSITLWFPPSYLPVVTGFTVALGTIGANIGGKPLAILAENVGWRNSFVSLAILGISIAFLSWLLISKTKNVAPTYAQNNTVTTNHKHPLKTILASRQAWLIAIFYFLIYTPLACLSDTWGVTYLSDVYNLTKVDAAAICLIIYIGVALGTPVIGMLSNKLKSRKKPIVICAMFTCSIFLTILYVPNLSIGLVQLLFFSMGVFLGGQKLVFTSICELMPKRISGVSIGFVNSICMLNGFILPMIVGMCLSAVRSDETRILSAAGEYGCAFFIPAVCMTVAMGLSFFLRESFIKEKA